MNTRGVLNIKGLDLNEDGENGKAFGLRADSLKKQGKDPAKKKGCAC